MTRAAFCIAYRAQAFDRILLDPIRNRLPRFASQRIPSAEVAVELLNGQPIQVVRSSFSILTFKKNGTLGPPLSVRLVRARAELALAVDNLSATQLWPTSVLDLSLEAVNGRPWGSQATHRANRPGSREMRLPESR